MTTVKLLALTWTILGFLWGRYQYRRGVLAGRHVRGELSDGVPRHDM